MKKLSLFACDIQSGDWLAMPSLLGNRKVFVKDVQRKRPPKSQYNRLLFTVVVNQSHVFSANDRVELWRQA